MKTSIAQRLIKATAAFFDSRLIARVDLVTACDGQKPVYIDALGISTIPDPTSTGHNLYKHIPGDKGFIQEIHFQSGPPSAGVNGLTNESAISAVLHRISKQNETFPSAYNQLAILCLQTAMAALHLRVKDRKEFGIYDTQEVEPSAAEDEEITKALALMNSIGLLGDLLIKFDRSYALSVPGEIHKQIDRLANYVKPDDQDVNIISATTMMSAAIQASGIGSFWRELALSIQKAFKENVDGKQSGEDTSTDQSA